MQCRIPKSCLSLPPFVSIALSIYSLIFGCSYFQKVDQLCNKGIKKVSCGTQFSAALACDGHVYTFGQGRFYVKILLLYCVSIYFLNFTKSIHQPKYFLVSFLVYFLSTLAYANVFTWPPVHPSERLIGLPDSMLKNKSSPQVVPSLEGLFIEDIAVGCEHVLALSSTGDVYAWGCNSEGQVTNILYNKIIHFDNLKFVSAHQKHSKDSIVVFNVCSSLALDTLTQLKSPRSLQLSRGKTLDRSLLVAATVQHGPPPLPRWKTQVHTQSYSTCTQILFAAIIRETEYTWDYNPIC